MAQTVAERQRTMRAKRARERIGTGIPDRERSEGEQRLDVWLRTSAFLALGHLATAHGLTRRQALEQVLLDAWEREPSATS